jgi:hypothetical protein
MLFRGLAIVMGSLVVTACSYPGPVASEASLAQPNASTPTLVGAWEVTASRAKGVGKNLLTFSSDGTFFRSGDTHPVVSGGHGAWKLTGPNQFNASYVSFSFDQAGKWVGVNRNNLQLTLAEDGMGFQGTVKSSNRDLDDKVVSTSTSPLAGKRILVQAF